MEARLCRFGLMWGTCQPVFCRPALSLLHSCALVLNALLSSFRWCFALLICRAGHASLQCL